MSRRQRKRLQKRMNKATDNGGGSQVQILLNRFDVQPVENNNKLPNGSAVPISNKFGLLDHSVHDEATPGKDPTTFSSTSSPIKSNVRQRLKYPANVKTPQQHRSKSTSPQRVNSTTKQKVLFKNFNPDKVEWMKK